MGPCAAHLPHGLRAATTDYYILGYPRKTTNLVSLSFLSFPPLAALNTTIPPPPAAPAFCFHMQRQSFSLIFQESKKKMYKRNSSRLNLSHSSSCGNQKTQQAEEESRQDGLQYQSISVQSSFQVNVKHRFAQYQSHRNG